MILAAMMIGLVANSSRSKGESPIFTESFDKDPKWEGYRNRLLPDKLPIIRQDFGFRKSHNAGGDRAGEIGGTLFRTVERAYYAKAIPPKTLNDRLTASGKFAVPRAGGGSGVLVGWFNHEKSQGWRTPSSLALRLDGNGGKHWVFFEYGTSKGGAGGGGAFEGDRYQTTKTPPFPADGAVHEWALSYDPQGAEGPGLIKFRCDGKNYEVALEPGHKEQGATFDRFGVWNQQSAGDSLDLYLNDLEIDGVKESFDADPKWESDGNPKTYEQRVIRPYHDFGYIATARADGRPGEVGGVMFRDEQPMYYADRVGPFSLDDALKAAGTIVIDSAGADSALQFGWFGRDAKVREKSPSDRRQKDYLAIVVEGPSRVGHFFRAGYATAAGSGDAPAHEGEADQRPVILPDGKQHRWTMHYQPNAADGRGRISVTYDDETHHLDLKEGERAEGATFDRFGFFNIEEGGMHVRAFLDDISYSK